MLKIDIAKLFANQLALGEKQSHLNDEYWFTLITKKEEISAIPQKIKTEANKKVSGFFDSKKTNAIYIAMRPKTNAVVQIEQVKLKFIKLIKTSILSNPDDENTLEESVVDVNIGKDDEPDIYIIAGFEISY